MTGVFNRRYMQERLEAEIAITDSGGSSFGVIMVDVDDFKMFNDRYGHTAGDRLLQLSAEALQSRLRKDDAICRFGGDEFCLILVGANLDDSTRRANELCEVLKESLQSHDLEVTVSMGVAAYPEIEAERGDVVKQADDALYRAKLNGKDQVVSAAGNSG
jgi:diguanylate cyclase (GGDEF)-like protein